MSFDCILVPTDGGDTNEPAETRAIQLAAEQGASLEVLHVVEALSLPVGDHRDALLETLDSEANAIVDRVVGRAADAGVVDATGTVTHGRAPSRIVEIAAKRGCDVIVMGTHGRAENQPYILGSVTARVLQHSPVEVLVVPTHTDRK
ncbi:hypothetical protein C454_18304 [Haloferax gibbonsii ATCC 33959]|uniref:UspA domain-containing protein n=1 Tax=Haloferax gibbonsii (strain ATCC 33959 / DSM 4427 / JCM 8863 / NBRC 102184 / NCIMB 2188 / Ma 2.38) TaxID=1227459 RepID=M0GVK4_HALGM|nr:universal stress protein [Haloferax gibbonsii]ELZ76276.1 hypothetical protein C454_18304 [Haloferax gibbonsii ATCC 33959]